MNNKTILESLSMDLLRIALGLHRGSFKMANRFAEEAIKRQNEIDQTTISPYGKNLLKKIDTTIQLKDNEKKAEDALMYSTLVRNYSQTF